MIEKVSRRMGMATMVLVLALASVDSANAVEDRFDDMPKLVAARIPSAGTRLPKMAVVEQAIKKFMARKGIGALTFAVSKDGKVLYDRAFGWADSGLEEPLQPGVKMRVASLTKPVVMACVVTLASQGKIRLGDRVFAVLNLAQFPEAKSCDARFREVTIQQLLDHEGGWDSEKSGDLTMRSNKIAKMFHIKMSEMNAMHVVRYGLTLPMDFDPGEREVYCNFGYIMLARVIEKVSGQKFMDYVHDTVGRKSGALSFSASSSDARDRQPGEIWYCYHPEYPRKEVPLSFRIEARDGAGILACTAADYCRFLETYWISGRPRTSGRATYFFDGSHAGVTAVCSQRADGYSYVAIANRREDGNMDWNDELRRVIDEALEKVEE